MTSKLSSEDSAHSIWHRRRSIAYVVAFGIFLLANRAFTHSVRGNHEPVVWLTALIIATGALGFCLWRGERELKSQEDELQQKIHTESNAKGFLCAMVVTFLLCRLEQAGFHVMQWRLAWVLPILPYTVIYLWYKRRYQ